MAQHRHVLPVLLGLLALTAVAGTASLALRRGPAPERYFALPDFQLTERSGRTVALRDLAGRRWVANFIFTTCGGICPAMTARMARLRREVPADVVFVSLTVDPTHDTPRVLTDYARRAGADEGWLFLTGEQGGLHRLATEGFKLAAFPVPPGQQAGGDGPFLHSPKFVLVDGEGTVRGYYDSDDEAAMAALARDVLRVPAGS